MKIFATSDIHGNKALVYSICDYKPKGLKIKIHNRIPIARGLGSSAAAIVAGAVAANELCGNKLSR